MTNDPGMINGPEMTNDPGKRLSAALRAQAAGIPVGPTPDDGPAAPVPADRRSTQPRSALPAWAVLGLAAVLGALAGGLAGVISAW